MSDNVHSMMQRDVKLTGLDQRTDALKDEASQFNSLASKLNKRYWWNNTKKGASKTKWLRQVSAEGAPDAAAGAGGLQPGEDGAIVGGPRTPQQIAAQKRLQQTQAQVDEVVDIMKTNVEKVLERDQKLSELDDRADALQQGASQFEQQAGKLKRKFWLQNLKMMIIMGVIGLVILAIIVDFFPCEQPQLSDISIVSPSFSKGSYLHCLPPLSGQAVTSTAVTSTAVTSTVWAGSYLHCLPPLSGQAVTSTVYLH
ncbi:hypothetical protein L9F63_015866, partial [Diploptera punctata]